MPTKIDLTDAVYDKEVDTSLVPIKDKIDLTSAVYDEEIDTSLKPISKIDLTDAVYDEEIDTSLAPVVREPLPTDKLENIQESFIEAHKHIYEEHESLTKERQRVWNEIRAGESDKTYKKDIKPILKRMTELTKIKEDIEEQVYGEGLQEPWVDPTMAAGAGFGAGVARKAVGMAGKSLLKRAGERGARGLASAATAVPAEYVVGHGAEIAAEDNPELALLLSIGVGLASGMTIEHLAERNLLSSAKKLAKKFSKDPRVAKISKQLETPTKKTVDKKAVKELKIEKSVSKKVEEAATEKVEKRVKKLITDKREEFLVEREAKRFSKVLKSDPKKGATDLITYLDKTYKMDTEKIQPFVNKVIDRVNKSKKPPVKKEVLTTKFDEVKEKIEDPYDPRTYEKWVWGEDAPPKAIERARKAQRFREDKAPYSPMKEFYEEHIKGDRAFRTHAEMVSKAKKIVTHRAKQPIKIEDPLSGIGEAVDLKVITKKKPIIRTSEEARRIRTDKQYAKAAKKQAKEQYLKTTVDEKKAAKNFFTGVMNKSKKPIPDKFTKAGKVKPPIKDKEVIKEESKLTRFLDLSDTKYAKWVLSLPRRITNTKIKDEHTKAFWGLPTDEPKLWNDYIRNTDRDVQVTGEKALKLAKELADIAPTAAEQRRLMQIIGGSVTSNKKAMAKAAEVQEIHRLQNKLTKEWDLAQFSRFDKLIKKDRARLTRLTHGKDPYTIDDIKSLELYAKNVGVSEDLITEAVAKNDLRGLSDLVSNSLKFHKQRLEDYYHFGSAKEYTPILREQFEKPTKEMRKKFKKDQKDLQNEFNAADAVRKKELQSRVDHLRLLESIYYGKKAHPGEVSYDDLRKLDISYTHQRKDIPEEALKALSKIEEAPYPIAKNLRTQGVDIHTANLYKIISDNPEWALSKAAMDNKIKGSVKDPSSKYIPIDDKRFGALDGMWLRKDVWYDLKDTQDMRNAFIKGLDKWVGRWKVGKVILNPAAQSRNFYTNHILAWMDDVRPGDKSYKAAIKAVMNKKTDKYYKEAEDWGLFNNTFYTAEMNVLREDLQALRLLSKKVTKEKKGKWEKTKEKSKEVKKAFGDWANKGLKVAANTYEANEHFFKTAVFIKNRMRGKSIDESARQAEKIIFNYADVPEAVKHIKRWVHPFFTFAYKSVPLMAEMMIRKPHKVAMIAASMYAVEEASRRVLGMTREEQETERKALADWQKKKLINVPFTDDVGIGPHRYLHMPWGGYMNLEYILPFAMPEALPSHPLWNLAATAMTRTDPFTKKPIFDDEVDTSSEIIQKWTTLLYQQVMPGLAPAGPDFNKFLDGIQTEFTDKKIKDYSGEEVSLFHDAMLGSLFGIRLTKANTATLKKFVIVRINRYKRKVSVKKFKLKTKYQQGRISKEKYIKEVKKMSKRKAEFIKYWTTVGSKLKQR